MKPAKLLDWSGQTAVILAGGPSLTADQAARASCFDGPGRPRVIAVNTTAITYRYLWDVAYAGDFMWWKTSISTVRKTRALQDAGLWTCDRAAAERFGLGFIKGVNRLGLGLEHIHTNGNSGAQAINLTYLFGARRILLLGFDMKLGPNGEKHHHPDHPAPCVQSQTFGDWLHKFEFLARDLKKMGCEVVNCTPGSALKCFPVSTIEKELP